MVDKNRPTYLLTQSDILKAIKNGASSNSSAASFGSSPVVTIANSSSLEGALDRMLNLNIRRLVVVDENGYFCGLLTQDRILRGLESDVYRVTLKISHIIRGKKELVVAQKNITLVDALNLMISNNIGSLIVKIENNCYGIITERDMLKPLMDMSRWSEKIERYVATPIVSIDEESSVVDAIRVMEERDIRHLVVNNSLGVPKAIFTNRDIMITIKGSYGHILETKLKYAKEVMNELPESIFEIKVSGEHQKIVWINRQALNIFGSKIIDSEISTILGEKSWILLYNILKTEKRLKNHLLMVKDRAFEISGFLMPTFEESVIKLIFKDITDHLEKEKRLEEQIQEEIEKRLEKERLLLQQSKLAAMGEMVANITHQWRQPLSELSGIFMNLSARWRLKKLDSEKFFEKIDEGFMLLSYMSHTIEDFREFYTLDECDDIFNIELAYIKAVRIIEASLSFCHIELKANCVHAKSKGNINALAQAILNILSNARDVLSKNNHQKREIRVRMSISDRFCTIEIEDSGGGIKVEPITKIFDPYITTKSSEGGSGIGLYMSKTIVENLGGKIEVENSKEGAIFRVILPTVKEQ